MRTNMQVCFVLLASFAIIATLGAQVKSSDKLATLSSTISGIMVKPTAEVLPASTATTGAASTAAANNNKSPLVSFEDMDEADEDDLEDQVQAIPQPSSQPATLVPSATSSDLKAAAGYHYPSHHEASGHHGGHHYGKYYQYASVPYPYAWEFGYRRGNPYHTIERHEKGKGSHFHTKVKWNDKHAGYGVHVWDYNHDDHHSGHYGGSHHDADHHSYGHHGASHHGYGGHH